MYTHKLAFSIEALRFSAQNSIDARWCETEITYQNQRTRTNVNEMPFMRSCISYRHSHVNCANMKEIQKTGGSSVDYCHMVTSSPTYRNTIWSDYKLYRICTFIHAANMHTDHVILTANLHKNATRSQYNRISWPSAARLSYDHMGVRAFLFRLNIL